MHPAPPAGPITRSSPLSGRRIVRSLTSRPKPSPLARQPLHRWRAGGPAFLAGEPVTIAGFIDHGGPESLDEILVEFEGGEERAVHRGELTARFDVIEGQWSTREVHLAGGRLNPGESLAVVPHAPDGFRWGSVPAPPSSPSRSCFAPPTAKPPSRTTRRSTARSSRLSRTGTSPCALPPCTSGSQREPAPEPPLSFPGHMCPRRPEPEPGTSPFDTGACCEAATPSRLVPRLHGTAAATAASPRDTVAR